MSQGSIATTGVPLRERIMFGLGDTAQNVFMTVSLMFISIFYTDVFGLSPAFVGTLFLVARIIDAITDPLVGTLTDKWVGRLGRYRTWMLWAALPYSASLVLVFWAPELSDTSKQIYAAITYIFLIVANSCYAVPYVSLNGVVTSDPQERIDINVVRFPLSKVGGFLCNLFVPILMGYFVFAETAYRVSMSLMAVVVFVMALLCVMGTRERVTEAEIEGGFTNKEKESGLGALGTVKALWENDQTRVLCAYAVTFFCAVALRGGATAYYVLYYLNAGEYWLSVMLTSGAVISMLPAFFAGWLIKQKICNSRTILVWSQFISAILCGFGYLIKQDGIILALILNNLIVFAMTCQDVVVWSATGNCADYGVAKYKKNIRGVINGALMFCLKLGMAIGGALIGYILAFYGYTGGKNITPEQLDAILLITYGVPLVFFLIAGFIGYKWKLTPEYMVDFKEKQTEQLIPAKAN
ncbi:beta-glucoside transporter [Vibrio ishigakensis]|uniref:Beta-glucoside transporter n=1 Tax=Vibrio ishigakensis TaxID=1481914 RepID=A0A0B8QHK2_9VIBR|nr:beta-glucoside transporter [Vibrio ishigakensis]